MRGGRRDTDWMKQRCSEERMPGTVILCIPHFPPQYRPTLTAKVRVRSPPHRGTLTLARKQGRGGCGGGMPTGCPARGVDQPHFGTTGAAKWQAEGSVNSLCDLYALC